MWGLCRACTLYGVCVGPAHLTQQHPGHPVGPDSPRGLFTGGKKNPWDAPPGAGPAVPGPRRSPHGPERRGAVTRCSGRSTAAFVPRSPSPCLCLAQWDCLRGRGAEKPGEERTVCAVGSRPRERLFFGVFHPPQRSVGSEELSAPEVWAWCPCPPSSGVSRV